MVAATVLFFSTLLLLYIQQHSTTINSIKLKMDLILILAEYGYPPMTNDEVFKEIFEQAENFKKYND